MNEYYEVYVTKNKNLVGYFIVKTPDVTSENIDLREANVIFNTIHNNQVDPVSVEDILSMLYTD